MLYPSETGTTFRLGKYRKRCLKPLAKKAGIPDLTYPALRRTYATHFQKHGKPRDIQAQLRHSRLEMTGRYVKEIPEQVRTAVDSMDRELCPETGQEVNLFNRANVTQINPVIGTGAIAQPGFLPPLAGAGARQIQFSLDFEF